VVHVKEEEEVVEPRGAFYGLGGGLCVRLPSTTLSSRTGGGATTLLRVGFRAVAEQRESKAEVLRLDDVFAWGCVLWWSERQGAIGLGVNV
jgi:hypothetical protein